MIFWALWGGFFCYFFKELVDLILNVLLYGWHMLQLPCNKWNNRWLDGSSFYLSDRSAFVLLWCSGLLAGRGFLCSCSNFPFSSLLIVNHKLGVDATLMVGLRAWNKVLWGVIMTTVNAIPFYSFLNEPNAQWATNKCTNANSRIIINTKSSFSFTQEVTRKWTMPHCTHHFSFFLRYLSVWMEELCKTILKKTLKC